MPAVYTAGTAGICSQLCAGTGTGTGTNFRTGTPDASVSSVRHQHRYRKLREGWYEINTGTENVGKFDMRSTPVPAVTVHTFVPAPDTSVSSVHLQYRYRAPR